VYILYIYNIVESRVFIILNFRRAEIMTGMQMQMLLKEISDLKNGIVLCLEELTGRGYHDFDDAVRKMAEQKVGLHVAAHSKKPRTTKKIIPLMVNCPPVNKEIEEAEEAKGDNEDAKELEEVSKMEVAGTVTKAEGLGPIKRPNAGNDDAHISGVNKDDSYRDPVNIDDLFLDE
jgi:hypothetical protein